MKTFRIKFSDGTKEDVEADNFISGGDLITFYVLDECQNIAREPMNILKESTIWIKEVHEIADLSEWSVDDLRTYESLLKKYKLSQEN